MHQFWLRRRRARRMTTVAPTGCPRRDLTTHRPSTARAPLADRLTRGSTRVTAATIRAASTSSPTTWLARAPHPTRSTRGARSTASDAMLFGLHKAPAALQRCRRRPLRPLQIGVGSRPGHLHWPTPESASSSTRSGGGTLVFAPALPGGLHLRAEARYNHSPRLIVGPHTSH